MTNVIALVCTFAMIVHKQNTDFIIKERHLSFPIHQKNTNLEEDIEILVPVKFLLFTLSSFREVEIFLKS